MIIKRIFRYIKWVVTLLFITSILSVIIYRFIPVYCTPLMFIRTFQQIAKGEKVKLYHQWISIDEMPENLKIAVIASEDQKFLEHNGFDYKAIKNAVKNNIHNNKKLRGGSTISQQTAKNVFLWQGRTWIRKGLETYFTVLIELLWSKERIMEVYLNSIEMGDGIYGIKAVAEKNFNAQPLQLSQYDCALIAATLPNPRDYSSKNPNRYIRKRAKQIQKQMNNIAVTIKGKL